MPGVDVLFQYKLFFNIIHDVNIIFFRQTVIRFLRFTITESLMYILHGVILLVPNVVGSTFKNIFPEIPFLCCFELPL